MTGLPALVADAERQLSAPLALLVAVLEGDHDPAHLARLNAAAEHVHAALCELAHMETPARPALLHAGALGGPGQPPTAMGEAPVPGPAAARDQVSDLAAAGESDRVVTDALAGAGAGGAASASPGATYVGLAGQPIARHFREGRHRLIGHVGWPW